MTGGESAEPSAPHIEEINRITTVADIVQVQHDDLPQVYFQSINIIHQSTAEAIQNALNEVPMTVLSQLHSLLCAKVSAAHDELQGRRIIRRSITKTVVLDIINLGLCVVNGEISRDLDKIFLEKLKGPSESSDDIYSKYVELMELVSEYANRLEKVETELRQLKSQRAGATPQNSNNTPDEMLEANNQLLAEVETVSTESSGVDSSVSNMRTENSPVSPAITSVNPVSPSQSTAVSAPTTPGASASTSVVSTASSSATTSSSANQSRVTASQSRVNASQSRTPANQSRVTAARTTRSHSEPTAEIYIGGAAGNVSCEDVHFELSTMGVQVDKSNIRILSDKHDWRSFIAKVPKSKEQFVCSHPNWPKDLRVRPFRAPGTAKSQPAARQQESRRKQSQMPRQRWSDTQRKGTSQSWSRKQHASPVSQLCECQAESWDNFPRERQSDWRKSDWRYPNRYDAPYDYDYVDREWYDSEFPALDKQYDRYYRY